MPEGLSIAFLNEVSVPSAAAKWGVVGADGGGKVEETISRMSK